MHDFAMLMPNYLVLQMEQEWSLIAFVGKPRMKFAIVMANALFVQFLTERLGYPYVYAVPVVPTGPRGCSMRYAT